MTQPTYKAYRSKNQISLHIVQPNYSILLILSKREWNLLIRFCKITKNRNFLPKGKIQASQVDLPTSKIYYIERDEKKFLKRMQQLLGDVFKEVYTTKEKKRLKEEEIKRNKEIIRKGLPEKIYIRTERTSFCFEREEFRKFRDFILKPNNLIEYKY